LNISHFSSNNAIPDVGRLFLSLSLVAFVLDAQGLVCLFWGNKKQLNIKRINGHE
jgi:hypothetical protein